MNKWVLQFALVAMLSGCETFSPPVPEDYKGPVAIFKDSVLAHSASKADFFYLSEIDGRRIEDSRLRTLTLNQGRGFRMTPHTVERNVPARPATFKIVGRTEYAAPILAIANTVFQVAGTTTFSPETFKSYVVRGVLGENYSAVWIEEETTNKKVGETIEVHGSAALGLFQK